MKKGFTLIELLSVIVILAIIAVIAVPIVIDIIDDSKKNATLRSAQFYLEALEMSVADRVMHHRKIEDKAYQIMSDGNICLKYKDDNITCEDKLTIKVKGETPTSGTITIQNGNIKDVDFKISENRIVKNSKGEIIYFPCTLISGEANEIGSKYECEVSPGVKYNFYVLSYNDQNNILTNDKNDGFTTNLIMDRNMCEDGTPTDVEKEDKCLVEYSKDRDAKDVGPVTAMNYLNKGTSSWSNIQNLNITYDDEGMNFTGFKITGKARMPYKNEVESANENNKYLYEYLDDGSWIAEGITQPSNNIKEIYGYWTLSSYSENSTGAYLV